MAEATKSTTKTGGSDEATAAAKKVIGEQAEARAKAIGDAPKSTPTPTQEENDLTALGVPILTHADDGSGPDPRAPKARQSEADKPAAAGAYQTRDARPASSSGSHGQHRGSAHE